MNKPLGIRKYPEKEFLKKVEKWNEGHKAKEILAMHYIFNTKNETLTKLAQIENSEPPVPPDSKNTQFVNFGPKLWKFMQ